MESTCIDGYYMLGPGMSIKKRSNLVKVMKSAISISKSQTGDTVVRINKRENRHKGENLLAVERMQTYSQITLDHSTRLFERNKRSLIKFHNDHSIPEPIRRMQSRYDELKEQMKMRQVTMWNKATDEMPVLPELSSALTERLRRDGNEPRYGDQRHGDQRHGDQRYGDQRHGDQRHGDQRHGDQRNGDQRHGDQRHYREPRNADPTRAKSVHEPEAPKGPPPEHPMVTQSLPSLRGNSARRRRPLRRTEIVTRESMRKPGGPSSKFPTSYTTTKQNSTQPMTPPMSKPDWCDKPRIFEYLQHQTQHQEAMLYKLKLDRWNTMMTEKEKGMNEKYPGDETHHNHHHHHQNPSIATESTRFSHPPHKSDGAPTLYSQHSMYLQTTKAVDRGFPKRKKKFPLKKRVAERIAMKKAKGKRLRALETNKSVTFVE